MRFNLRDRKAKLPFVIVILVVIAVTAGVAAAAKRESVFALLGEQYSANAATAGAETVVARVDGEDVTLAEVLDHKALLQAKARLESRDPNGVSLADAFSDVIRAEVQIAEAKRRGISVDWKEALDVAAQQRKLSESASNQNPEVTSDLISGMGVTAEDFWTKIMPARYQQSLYVVKLRQDVYSHLFPAGQAASAQDIQTFEADYQKLVDGLVDQAKVDVLDQTLGLTPPR